MKKLLFWIRKQDLKQIFSATMIIIGAALIIFAKRGMNKVAAAKSTIDHVSDFFTNANGMWDPVIKFFGGQAHKEASKYDTTLAILFLLGISLVVLGAAGLFWFWFRKRRSRT